MALRLVGDNLFEHHDVSVQLSTVSICFACKSCVLCVSRLLGSYTIMNNQTHEWIGPSTTKVGEYLDVKHTKWNESLPGVAVGLDISSFPQRHKDPPCWDLGLNGFQTTMLSSKT